jgi:hypothetical protein
MFMAELLGAAMNLSFRRIRAVVGAADIGVT